MPGSDREPKVQNPKSKIAIWVTAARPKTLAAAVVPVVIGTAMAYADGALHAPSAACALLAAIFIQIGTNFSNDYLDFEKGADSESRKGPLRVTQAGLVSVNQIKWATHLTFGLAFASGLYLIYRGGWPVLLVGLLSITAGIVYTAGRYSLAYLGLGDVAVLIFFGPVAVAGTYYVQALTLTPAVLVSGLAPGLLSVAILLVNNIRDEHEDRRANKMTLVARFGRRFGTGLYTSVVVTAALVPVVLYLMTGRHPWAMAAAVILPLAYPNIRTLRQTQDPAALNPLLGATAQLLVLYGLVFTIGWIV